MKKIFEIKKQRNIDGILEASFKFFRIHAKKMIKIIWEQNSLLIIGLLASYFLYNYYYFGMMSQVMNLKNISNPIQINLLTPKLALVASALFLFSLFFTPRFFAAILGYFRAYNQETGEADEVKIKALVNSKFWGLIALTIILFFLFVFGAILVGLLVAGLAQLGTFGIILIVVIAISILIYALMYFSLVYYVYFFEDLDFFEAMIQTKNYLKGRFWFSLGLMFLMSVIIGLIAMVLNAPVSIYVMLKTLFMAKQSAIHQYAESGDILVSILAVISYAGQLILRILSIISIVFLYFSLKEYHTGDSLLEKIDQIGETYEDRNN